MPEISFEEFMKNCSFDQIDRNDKIEILCIYSQGYSKKFNKELVIDKPEIVNELVAWDLYNIIKKDIHG